VFETAHPGYKQLDKYHRVLLYALVGTLLLFAFV
jgi:hypothetical protein